MICIKNPLILLSSITSVVTMSFTEKIDVLDLLINILREHEEKMDKLVTRLEQIIENVEAA